MDLNEWRKQRAGEAFTLPSGLEVKLKRCQLLDLAELGQIPAPLAGLANNLLASESLALTVDDYRKYAPMISLIAGACLVEPVDLAVDELPAADRLAIYNWANDITVAVRPFRPKSNGNEAPGRSGEPLRSKTKRAARHPG